MAYIPDSVIDEILSRVDIVDFIGRYVSLKRAGTNYKGLCPFHGDKDPSLSVSADKGLWKCFGCGLGGNLITFVQRKENIEFPEAVRFIAELYNIEIPATPGEKPGRTRVLYDINRHAEEFFIRVLKSKYGRPFREYLNDRQYDRKTLEAFHIGSSLPTDIPDALTKELTSTGFAVDDLITVGLAKKGDYGVYDAFRGRLIIPIRDVLTHTIGFGARILKGDGPKYVNSSESLVFKKGDVLFGINLAKSGIRQEGFILLMEGYTDVMRCHQYGLTNAVASMGTALTPKQAGTLRRYSEEIILCYDADEAGQKSVERSLPSLLTLEMKPRVLLMPPGEDPDSVLLKKGVDEFRKMLDRAVHFVDFLLNRATGGEAPSAVEAKIEAFRKLLPSLDVIPHMHLREEYLNRVGRALGINPSILLDIANAPRKGIRESIQTENIKLHIEGENDREREFIAGLIKHPQFASDARKELTDEDFVDSLHAEVFSIISDPSFPLDTKDLSVQPRIYENKKVFGFVVDCIFADSQKEIDEKYMRHLLYMLIERKILAENRRFEQRHQSCDEDDSMLQAQVLLNCDKLQKLRKKLLG